MKELIYICEAYTPPMLKWREIFLASMYTQIKAPNKILGFSDDFLFIIFFSVLN